MQHLDEGTLQAWLDGARGALDAAEAAEIERHLGACSACAARAEALRETSLRALSLLAIGGGQVASGPPYEQLTERARGARRLSLTRGRWTATAWAASIVGAIGFGWAANELYRVDSEVATPVYRLPAVRATVADAAEGLPPGSDGAALAPAETGQPASAGVLLPPVVVADAGVGSVASDSTPLAAAPEPLVTTVDAAAVSPPSGVEAASPAADGQVVVSGVVVDENGRPLPAVQVYVPTLDVGVLTRGDGAYSLSLPGPGDSAGTPYTLTVERIGYRAQTQELTGRGGERLVADFRLQEEALQLDEIIVTGAPGGTQRRAIGNTVASVTVAAYAWRPAERASAESAIGEALRTVPGIDVLTVETVEIGDPSATIARVRQDLGNGVVLTLIEGVGGDDLAAWPVPSEGAKESTRLGELLVTGTAAVPPDSLRALLGSLR